MAGQHRRLSGAPANHVVESQSMRVNEQSHYRRYEHAHGASERPLLSPKVEEVSVPVMLCHTCSHCGRMRSTGFHRNNPVLPGKSLVGLPCRRCKKKLRSDCYSSYTRRRSCTADVPCDWPSESFHLDVDRGEDRGRRRYRDELHATYCSPGRRRVVQRSSSRIRLGLGALQQPSRRMKSETRVRVSSLSPHRYTRSDKLWPPPDVVSTRPITSSEMFSSNSEFESNRSTKKSEIWPPPDVVPTRSYQKIGSARPYSTRISSRIIELSPSPSPPRTRWKRYGYERQGRRSRSRSSSSTRSKAGQMRRDIGVEARITAHPRPYRPVLPDHQAFHRSSEANSSDDGLIGSRRANSPSNGILKAGGREHETSYRRKVSMHDHQQSNAAEAGGPRVQFAAGKQNRSPVAAESKDRAWHLDGQHPRSESHRRYHSYSQHRYVESPVSTVPRMEEPEDLGFRHVSPSHQRRSGGRDYSRPRQRSSFSSPRFGQDKLSPRHASQGSFGLEHQARSGYRHVSRTNAMDHTRNEAYSLSHHVGPEDDLDDMTDSESAASGGVAEVRSWRGIDEHGQPATFVEERRSVKMLEPESERDAIFRPWNERLASKAWKDV